MADPRTRSLLAAVGALLALLAWLTLGALTGLGKLGSILLPLAPLAALAGGLVALTRARPALWIAAGVVLLAGAVVALTPFATRGLPLHALVRRDALPASLPLDAVIVLSGGIPPDSLLEPEAAPRAASAGALGGR